MHLHIDCSFGVSGDMLLSALCDAGADVEAVVGVLEQLAIGDFEIRSEKMLRGGIGALHINVVDNSDRPDHEDSHPHGHHDHDHHHDHGHDHPHDHPHPHDHEHEHPDDGHRHHHHHEHKRRHGSGGPHRHLRDLMDLLDPEVLSKRVRARAEKVFRIVAEAEAAVHSQPVERVHFHEISGIDTAVDVIGVCVAMEMLNADSVSAAIPAAGTGMVMCEHGVFSVPAPATLEILKSRNIPWRQGGDGERMTPTGAALLAGLVDSFGSAPELTVTRIGYGAGTRDFADSPNLLRVIVGKPASFDKTRVVNVEMPDEQGDPTGDMPLTKDILFPPADWDHGASDFTKAIPDRVMEFRTVLDDMTPESVAHAQGLCLAAGAVEAYCLPVAMKKGRLGHELTVLAPIDKAADIADLLWRNTSTFGIRFREASRLTLAREIRTVDVEGEAIRIKLGWFGREIIRRQPEYEDCRRAAEKLDKPLDEIFLSAKKLAADLE